MTGPVINSSFDITQQEWRDEALCAQPENKGLRWHPRVINGKAELDVPEGRPPAHDYDGTSMREPSWSLPARELCAKCPVQAECREQGVIGREHGVWGGLLDLERDMLAAYRRGTRKPPPPCPVCGSDSVHTARIYTHAMCLNDHTHRFRTKGSEYRA